MLNVSSLFLFVINFFLPGEPLFPPIHYQLNVPDKKYELPAILNEVSGLTDIDADNIACVQDELGIIFIYNLAKESIAAQYPFEPVGDFEGLTRVGNSMYILRSDGRLTEMRNYTSSSRSVKHFNFSLFTPDNEGLCYDSKHNRLLIAAKSKPGEPYLQNERLIYSFNLKTMQLDANPYLRLNVKQLMDACARFNITLKQKKEKDGTSAVSFNFRPASLAVHPVTDQLYILSASDKLLIVTDRKGSVLNMYELDPVLFAKAEGITFLDDGTMFITNEARGASPTLLIFKPITQ